MMILSVKYWRNKIELGKIMPSAMNHMKYRVFVNSNKIKEF